MDSWSDLWVTHLMFDFGTGLGDIQIQLLSLPSLLLGKHQSANKKTRNGFATGDPKQNLFGIFSVT